MASIRIERRLWAEGYRHVAGVDEAGRGCLAGPVVAAAVIFPREKRVRGVKDSKLLPPEEREKLARRIRRHVLAVGVGHCSPTEIDELNILWASMEAMRRAVENLEVRPGYVLVDGNQVIPGARWPLEPVVKGDQRSQAIAAASIIAKTERDYIMRSLHDRHPEYGWFTNVGYPTRYHYDALNELGPTPLHRKSFNLGGPDPQTDLFEIEQGARAQARLDEATPARAEI